MNNQEAIEMLTAKAECIRREASGIDVDCNHRNCDECDLCYKQGTMGDQMEALGVAISALQEQDSRRICNTCKHDPPSKKWPCVDCDMRELADRWEPKEVKNSTESSSTQKELDTISRQALCEYALNQKDKSVTPNDIMRFPSAQPETGYWISARDEDGRHMWLICSECRAKETNLKAKYCPVCGRKMA